MTISTRQFMGMIEVTSCSCYPCGWVDYEIEGSFYVMKGSTNMIKLGTAIS